MSLIRIAMWSGPRNISTAMMRSWENRRDTVVIDEPFYGPFLAASGENHPLKKEVIAAQGADYRAVIDGLLAPQADSINIFYQKHMAHHMLDMNFVKNHLIVPFKHAFLIRNPKDVVRSYVRKYPYITAEALGYSRQVSIFNMVKNHIGHNPPVVESVDVLNQPKATLEKLCQALNVTFDDAMLSWPTGYRDSDGVWASHWYNRVIESTGFKPYQEKDTPLTPAEAKVAQACQDDYQLLRAFRL
ncbi:MAG: HAD family hydrolase [Proteobacteria bacterium]|nr:MAG: HAD family hydrolase [Pseudomonadota bacterium]